MNFEHGFKNLEQRINDVQGNLDELKAAYEDARDFTSIFLKYCEKHGISSVSVGTNTPLIKSCDGWPFGYDNHVFADGREGTWPAIWAVCDEMGFRGCGNTGEHGADCSKMVNGVYRYQDGKWERIDEDDLGGSEQC